MLWSDRVSTMSFVDVVIAVQRLLTTGFASGLPLRGAISMGPLSSRISPLPAATRISMASIYGKGLVPAHDIEKRQEWAGCEIDEACISAYNALCELHRGNSDVADLDHLVKTGRVAHYDVPRKNGNSRAWVVNWTMPGLNEDLVVGAFAKHGKNATKAQGKVENTVTFMRSMRAAAGVGTSCDVGGPGHAPGPLSLKEADGDRLLVRAEGMCGYSTTAATRSRVTTMRQPRAEPLPSSRRPAPRMPRR
jgi:hypothetical protein